MKESIKRYDSSDSSTSRGTPPGGAIGMIKAGVLDGVDAIIGIHVMATMKTGHIYYRSGNTQTGRSYFKLIVQGKGGHGSSPHMANDAIVAASSFRNEFTNNCKSSYQSI